MNAYDYLQVNADDLTHALADHLDEASWLLDLESGEVILAASEDLTGIPEDEAWEDPERFLIIDPMLSSEAFQFMEEFVDELPEGEACRALARSLRMPKPFRGFKVILADFPSVREQWFKYHHGRMLEYAEAWLEDNVPGARLGMG